MELHEKIYQLRKQAGMSQEEAADCLNVSRQALSRWENGTAQPAANNIVEICKLFGVTSDYLLNDKYESDDLRLRDPQRQPQTQLISVRRSSKPPAFGKAGGFSSVLRIGLPAPSGTA